MGDNANVYDIALLNKSDRSTTYGWFHSPPTSTSGNTVYSNVWIFQVLANKGQQEVQITKTFYAWCGTAPTRLEEGVQVSIGNSQTVVLGTQNAKGTTCNMYNNSGSPAFEDFTEAKAEDGHFAIRTKSDFYQNMNFLMGMATPDPQGRMCPTASFEATPNNEVQIKPHLDYYISPIAIKRGTAIDFKSHSATGAHINFSQHPGYYGAVVTHQNNGKFDVRYTINRTEHLRLKNSLVQSATPLEQRVNELERKLCALLKHLPNEALAIEDKEGDDYAATNGESQQYQTGFQKMGKGIAV